MSNWGFSISGQNVHSHSIDGLGVTGRRVYRCVRWWGKGEGSFDSIVLGGEMVAVPGALLATLWLGLGFLDWLPMAEWQPAYLGLCRWLRLRGLA